MEQHTNYKGFVYSGWQSALEIASEGFHLYTCRRCGTTIAERSIPVHSTEICDSIQKTMETSGLEKLLKD